MTEWGELAALMIGARIRDQRVLGFGWSQERLAFAMGTHRPIVGRVENGRRLPTLETLVQYSAALDLPLRELLECLDLAGPPPEGGPAR